MDRVNYKGYDIYPVVYRHEVALQPRERLWARPYSAAVIICDESHTPCSEFGRVYPVTDVAGDEWGTQDDAERAAMNDGIRIVDGLLEEGNAG